ncbi:hypothetical protein NPIL_625441 [Nephila pilipes]|uniref:Uncharacterized protein n=1 Tax=Nephila pilipes TaxID=299642 RepID=A0A8X6U466_NEPPI|nr:hypothetical protein NPIL_625441 [Nephila pilipes]
MDVSYRRELLETRSRSQSKQQVSPNHIAGDLKAIINKENNGLCWYYMCFNRQDKRNVEHCIEAIGFPVFSKPRCLLPNKLMAAKMELYFLMALVIPKLSKRSLSNPIFMVHKKKSEERSFGNFHLLDAITHNEIPCTMNSKLYQHSRGLYLLIDKKKIQYLKGSKDAVASALSSINPTSMNTPNVINFKPMSEEQSHDKELQEFLMSENTTYLEFPLSEPAITLYYDVSTGHIRPFVLRKFRKLYPTVCSAYPTQELEILSKSFSRDTSVQLSYVTDAAITFRLLQMLINWHQYSCIRIS